MTERARTTPGPLVIAVLGSFWHLRTLGSVIKCRVRIRGYVQGVGFRVSAAAAARSREVSGWIGNRLDGTVEAVFEGEPDVVEAMVRWCEEGPRGANVDGIEVFEERPDGLRAFEIR